jgi:hypothetical protein
MANNLLEVFGSYDLFGKSVPGGLLAFGILSSLPIDPVTNSQGNGSPSLAGLAVGVVGVLLVGLVIGQGVHTLADNTEKAFLWAARRASSTQRVVRTVLARRGRRFPSPNLSTKPDEKLRRRIWKEAASNLYGWLRRRFWGIYDSLASHRRLFGKHFEWNYSPLERGEGRRWQGEEKGHLYDQFCQQYTERFPDDLNPKQLDPDQMIDRYPLIVTVAESSDIEGHASFQSIYSFCRSMWVVSVVLAVLYTEILFGQLVNLRIGCSRWIWADSLPLDVGYLCLSESLNLLPVSEKAFGRVLLPEAFYPLVVPVLLTAALVFFDAAGTYKRHYVEYLIAEFASAENNSAAEVSDDG